MPCMDATTVPVGRKVRELRKARGLLQQELADQASVSRQTVVNLAKIAKGLGVGLGELFS
jgi:DNA-binding XRE family transcriptional regulator